MEKLRFSTKINAPIQRVWNTMFDDLSYRKWTEVFHSGSYYDGEWKTGSNIKFLAPEDDGTVSGMFSRIKKSRPPEFMSIQHLGEIINGEEKMWPESKTSGKEALENYTLKETPDGTEVVVEMDSPPEYKEMFQKTWPEALSKLKQLAEGM